MRIVDCLDCHNRPTHIYQAPDRTVNISLETGRLDHTLPFIKKTALEALVSPYRTQEEAREKIAATVRDFYARRYPEVARTRKESIDRASDELRAIYGRSIFPSMRADWRVHPDNIGHMLFDGCFRCHDNKHAGATGALPKGCDVCHDFGLQLAGPDTGMALVKVRPEHPVKLEGIHAELNCARCHTGGPAPEASCAGCHETQRLFRQGKSPSLDGLKETVPPLWRIWTANPAMTWASPRHPWNWQGSARPAMTRAPETWCRCGRRRGREPRQGRSRHRGIEEIRVNAAGSGRPAGLPAGVGHLRRR